MTIPVSTPDIRLSAQRALWGCVPRSLRAFSVEVSDCVIRTRGIFDETCCEEDRTLLSEAGAEIIADYSGPFSIEEEFSVVRSGEPMRHLTHVIFLRHER
jgi:hypothetical protein